MLLAHALSHLPSSSSISTVKLDAGIDHHGFTTSRLQWLKAETTQYPVISIAYDYTLDGWL